MQRLYFYLHWNYRNIVITKKCSSAIVQQNFSWDLHIFSVYLNQYIPKYKFLLLPFSPMEIWFIVWEGFWPWKNTGILTFRHSRVSWICLCKFPWGFIDWCSMPSVLVLVSWKSSQILYILDSLFVSFTISLWAV